MKLKTQIQLFVALVVVFVLGVTIFLSNEVVDGNKESPKPEAPVPIDRKIIRPTPSQPPTPPPPTLSTPIPPPPPPTSNISSPPSTLPSPIPPLEDKNLITRWIVVSSDNSSIIRYLCRLEWRVVIVTNTLKAFPPKALNERCTVLHSTSLFVTKLKISKFIKWDKVQRKNVGYLYALSQGATMIYDAEDEIPVNLVLVGENPAAKKVETNSRAYNILGNIFDKPYLARGLPMHYDIDPAKKSNPGKVKSPIQQVIPQYNPDFSELVTVRHPVPKTRYTTDPAAYTVPRGAFITLNHKNTIVYRSALWHWYMPVEVLPEYADIVRGYISQRFLWWEDATPIWQVVKSEQPTLIPRWDPARLPIVLEENQKITWLLNTLYKFKPRIAHRPSAFLEIYQLMATASIISEFELEAAKAWIQDINGLGYWTTNHDDSFNYDVAWTWQIGLQSFSLDATFYHSNNQGLTKEYQEAQQAYSVCTPDRRTKQKWISNRACVGLVVSTPKDLKTRFESIVPKEYETASWFSMKGIEGEVSPLMSLIRSGENRNLTHKFHVILATEAGDPIFSDMVSFSKVKNELEKFGNFSFLDPVIIPPSSSSWCAWQHLAARAQWEGCAGLYQLDSDSSATLPDIDIRLTEFYACRPDIKIRGGVACYPNKSNTSLCHNLLMSRRHYETFGTLFPQLPDNLDSVDWLIKTYSHSGMLYPPSLINATVAVGNMKSVPKSHHLLESSIQSTYNTVSCKPSIGTNALLQNLVKLHETLTSHNISYVLFYGSLLGYVREGSLIDGDDDIDILIDRRHYETVRKIYANRTSHIHRKDVFCQAKLDSKVIADMYFYNISGNVTEETWNFNGGGTLDLPNGLMWPAKEVLVGENVKSFVPNDPENLVAYLYGPRWREHLRKQIDYTVYVDRKSHKPIITYFDSDKKE